MMKKNNRRVVLAVVLILVVCAATIGGTIAWLTDKTGDVVNTFTPSNIEIDLTETVPANNTAKMVPGSTIAKDPFVTVKADSEACYLFVKIVESGNFDDFMEYTVATGWKELADVDGVYYREVADTDAAQKFAVLADDQVTVLKTVKKENMNALTAETYPTLTFTAFAIQSENVTIETAIEEAAKILGFTVSTTEGSEG